MKVIGTAGHVDHGKSTLIAALTGTHPDRLIEEQIREMTIELGFGWMTLPNGEEVGIVDVPGHRDFIENMLAGIGGIDAALLIIAADEGIMPQTKEHLSILDLLQIPAGLIVLTKTDLASDSAWLDLLETDIRNAVKNTVLRDASIVRVSAKNKAGLDKLIAKLETLLAEKPARLDLHRPRLPIDRVFTMSGFGTVVTGTLSDGKISVGDEIEILPSGQKGRVRGLQTHKKKEEQAVPGSRTAVNVSGIEIDSIRRGDVLVHPGQYQITRRLDAKLKMLEDASTSIKHGDVVKLFVGASETVGVIRLLGTEELSPNQEGWIQLESREPLVVVRGDRYILRRPSPGETLGGGIIVDPLPKGRHKRFDENVLNSLSSLAQGSPAIVFMQAAMAFSIANIKEVSAKSHLESSLAVATLDELIKEGQIVLLENGEINASSDLLITPASYWNELQERTQKIINVYHEQFPLRRGIQREELKSKLKLPARIFNAVIKKLVETNSIHDVDGIVSCPGYEIRLRPEEQVKVRELMRKFEENPFAPPSVKECQAEIGEELFNSLLVSDVLICVSKDVVFRKEDYLEMVEKVKAGLSENGKLSLADVRDMLNTTRKYVQALLEYMDATELTVREGDFRRLK